MWFSTATLGLLLLVLIGFQVYQRPNPTSKEIHYIAGFGDSGLASNDSMLSLNFELVRNKIIEDSLRHRIDRMLDTLDILQAKLKFMQSNSEITKEVIVGVLDSIESYREETEYLKREFDRVSRESSILLQKERMNSNELRKKVEEYERRLMALFAINLEVSSYRDGHDQNSKLVSSQSANKVREIRVTFKLSREITPDDKITLQLFYHGELLMELVDITIRRTIVRRSFDLRETTLGRGNYEVVILHDNYKYDISHEEIGRGSIFLE